MTHLWQFLRRYQGQAGLEIAKTVDWSPDRSLFYTDDSIYQQLWRRTEHVFNGMPVWQGILEPTTWIVRAKVPVSVIVGRTFTINSVLGKYLITVPDGGGAEIRDLWKMTIAPSFAAIADGFGSTDLFRGWSENLQKHPDIVLGAVTDGDLPFPGDYFKTLLISESGDSVYLNRYARLSPAQECAAAVPGSLNIPVASFVDMMELTSRAEQACIDAGKTMQTMIVTFTTTDGSRFVAEAYSCCL